MGSPSDPRGEVAMSSAALPILEPICNRCGKCCYFEYEGRKIRCPYLIIESENMTSCEIYEYRVGTIIVESTGVLYVCGYRKNQKHTIPNCPYNHLIKGERK